MDFRRENVIGFLAHLAMYGFFFATPLLGMMWKKWQESKRHLASFPDYEIRIEEPTPEYNAMMDGEGLKPFVPSLYELGFEDLGRYMLTAGFHIPVPVTGAPLASPDETSNNKQFSEARKEITRVFQHKDHDCIVLASISSEWDKKESEHILHIVSSGEGWVYASILGEAPGRAAIILPRLLFSYHPVNSVQELVDEHLRCRAEIARAGHFKWGAPMTMAEIFAYKERSAQALRDFGRHHSALSLMLRDYRAKRKGDWLGELEGKVSLPKASDVKPQPTK